MHRHTNDSVVRQGVDGGGMGDLKPPEAVGGSVCS